MEYRYFLEGSCFNGAKVLARGNSRKKKHTCYNENCRKKSLVKLVDITTNEYLDGPYGKCDHIGKCGYTRWPDKDSSKKVSYLTDSERLKSANIPATLTFIPDFILNATLKGYDHNTFITNLLTNIPFPFSEPDVVEVINLYHLGTVTKGYRKGAVTFPFIDIDENIRAIQVKQFNGSNHTISTDFIHSILERDYIQRKVDLPEWLSVYKRNERIVSCPFGEHLLRRYPNNPVALVEAPKTAVIGTLYYGFPNDPDNLIWLAVYNRSSFNYEKCKSLRGRKVVVLPDLGALQEWTDKTKMINYIFGDSNLVVNNVIEPFADEKDIKKGLDLADYLINFDWFQLRNDHSENSGLYASNKIDSDGSARFSEVINPSNRNLTQPKSFDRLQDELVAYFKKGVNWPVNIMLDKASIISEPARFIESHLSTVQRNSGNPTFEPFLNRLRLFKELTEKEITSKEISTYASDLKNNINFSSNEFTSNSDWEHG